MDRNQPAATPVGLAIVGAGSVVRGSHAPALRQLQDRFRVSVVCSRTIDSARKTALLLRGAAASSDLAEVLARPDVEAVLIAVPIAQSAGVARAALAAGKHVLLEKPLAASRREATELLEQSAGVPQLVAMVAENFRYAAFTELYRSLVWDGAIGTPEFAYCHSIGHVDPATQSTWRAEPAHAGGYLLDGGVHYAALLRIVLGEAIETGGLARVTDPRLGGPVGLSAHVRTDRGIQLIYTHLRTASPGARWSVSLSVFGSQGSVVLGTDGTIRVVSRDRPERQVAADGDLGHVAQLCDFFDAIRSGRVPRSSFREGWLDLLWIDAALQAAASSEARR